MNRRRSFHEADTRGGAHFPRPRSDRNPRGRPVRRTPADGGAAPHPARPSPGGGDRAVRPADHRRGGGGLFRGVAVLCPLPAPERRADRGGQPDLRGLHPHRGGGGGGRQQFYAPAGPDPGGRRAYRSRGIADHQQHGSGSNGGRPLFWPRHRLPALP